MKVCTRFLSPQWLSFVPRKFHAQFAIVKIVEFCRHTCLASKLRLEEFNCTRNNDKAYSGCNELPDTKKQCLGSFYSDHGNQEKEQMFPSSDRRLKIKSSVDQLAEGKIKTYNRGKNHTARITENLLTKVGEPFEETRETMQKNRAANIQKLPRNICLTWFSLQYLFAKCATSRCIVSREVFMKLLFLNKTIKKCICLL